MNQPTSKHTVSHSLRLRVLCAASLAFGVSACALAGFKAVADIALGAARKTFLGVATENYGEGYKDDFDRLLNVLTKPDAPADGAAQPGGAAAGAPVGAAPGTDPAAAGGTPGTPGAPVAYAPQALPPIELVVAVMREEIQDGRSIPVPVNDGEILYDRFGSHGDGDNLKISFRTNVDCFVYVISIDGTSWAQAVFPSNYAGFTNPVRGNQEFVFPEGPTWIPLDSYRGVEHLYFLATRTQRLDLEAALTQLASHVREADAHRADAQKPEVVAMAEVTEPAPIARGFDRARLSTVTDIQSSSGEAYPVQAQMFAARGEGDVLVTRWFRHQ